MKRSDIKRLLVSARNAQINASTKTNILFHILETSMDIDLENIPNNSAENANNLAEAIMCHIQYGECDLDELLNDIEQALQNYQTEKKAQK